MSGTLLQLYKRRIDNLNKRVPLTRRKIQTYDLGFSTTKISFHLLPTSLLLPRVQLVPPFSSTLSLFPLPELNHSRYPFLFLCVICGIIFLYLLLCCPVLVCSNYLFYVCITDCLNLLRFITVIYFVRFIIYCVFFNSLALYFVFLTCPIFIGRSLSL